MTAAEQSAAKAETMVRALRDRIYGSQSIEGWEACKENWLKPDSVKWLQNEAAKIPRPTPIPAIRLSQKLDPPDEYPKAS